MTKICAMIIWFIFSKTVAALPDWNNLFQASGKKFFDGIVFRKCDLIKQFVNIYVESLHVYGVQEHEKQNLNHPFSILNETHIKNISYYLAASFRSFIDVSVAVTLNLILTVEVMILGLGKSICQRLSSRFGAAK